MLVAWNCDSQMNGGWWRCWSEDKKQTVKAWEPQPWSNLCLPRLRVATLKIVISGFTWGFSRKMIWNEMYNYFLMHLPFLFTSHFKRWMDSPDTIPCDSFLQLQLTRSPPSAQEGSGPLHFHHPPQWNHLQTPGKAARPDSEAPSTLRKSADQLSLIHRNLHHLTVNMLCARLSQNLHHHHPPPRKTQALRTK